MKRRLRKLAAPVRIVSPIAISRGSGFALGPPAAACLDDVAGTVVVQQHALSHEVRERANLDLGMGDDRGGLVGLLGADAVPVVDDAGERAVEA